MESSDIGPGEVEAILEKVPEYYRELLAGRRTPPHVKLGALRDFMDRFGKPAVKAQLNQTISTSISPDQLAAARERLLADQKRVLTRIDEIKRAIAAPSTGEDHAVESEKSGVKVHGGERGNGEGRRNPYLRRRGPPTDESPVRERPREPEAGETS